MTQRVVCSIALSTYLVLGLLAAGCTVESSVRRDTGVSPSDAGTEDAFGDASRDAFVVPVDANFPHDSGPSDANMMTDAVGGGAGLMCTACMTDADCRAGSFCVQLASTGERVCLQSCNAEIPSCPHRFDCLNSILTPTAGPVCTPVGARCCIDADEDDHGFGVGCRGTDCDETNPHVYQGAPEVCNGFDDNCDGTPDDGNPGGGNLCMGSAPGVCSAGMTMCMAGSVSCVPNTSVGSMTESCNGLDDDCDGPIDEGFAFMGDPLFPGMSFPLQGACSVGLGACRRAGAVVCASGGASAICNVMAGTGTTEICNYIDDDCDGTVDDGFVSASGIYQADTDCGACGIDCTMIYAHPGTFGTCSLSGTRATCVMNCNAGSFNLNGIPDDGCEFMLDSSAIYVSGEDAAAIDDAGCGLGPSASGAGNHPCRTIAYGQGRATTTGRTRILVADALYNESITLVNGQSLMGGYRADTWERHLTTTLTTLRGTSGSGHRRTITAMNITSGLVEGFVIDGAAASTPGANSYAIYVSGGTSGLVIRNNVVYAGDGAPGSPGAAGVDGARGVPGTAGLMAFDTGVVVCSVTSAGGAGGVLSCGGTSVSGGAGGGAVCAPIADTTPPYTAFSARAGAAGSGTGGGAGGAAALDGATHSVGSTGNDQCGLCYLPLGGNTMTGSDGAAGAVGMNGGAGAGSASATGGIAGTDWVGAAGGPGSSGANGGGGGGGGAGGGDDGDGGAYTCTDDLGATGGGGGSGGCAGSAGIGGTAGGGSFGIFVVGTTNYPTLTGNTIYRGFGGAGGNGGRGGAGGVGGAGAAGGLKSNANSSFCTGDAGHGGNGGNAGHGGGGGGGAGGVSYGIYVAGTTGYGASTNTFPPSGGGGAGGGGGPSLGTSGTPGVAGASGTTD